MHRHQTTTFPLPPATPIESRTSARLVLDVHYCLEAVREPDREATRLALHSQLRSIAHHANERGELTGTSGAFVLAYSAKLVNAQRNIRLVEPGGPAYVTNGQYAIRATSQWTEHGQFRMCYVWRGDHPRGEHIASFPLNEDGIAIRRPDGLLPEERSVIMDLLHETRDYLPTIPIDAGRLTPAGLIAALIEAAGRHGAASSQIDNEVGDLADVLRVIASYLTPDMVLAIYIDKAIQAFLAQQLPITDPLHPNPPMEG